MASRDDIVTIATEFAPQLNDRQIDALATSTPKSGYDMDRVRTALGLKEKVKINDIKNAFWESKKGQQKSDACGKCKEHWVNWYDEYRHNKAWPITCLMEIPKSAIPCPECGSDSGRMLRRYQTMTEESQAWAWVVIYDFVMFQLEQQIHPDEFHPSMIWGSTADMVRPPMTSTQKEIMNWVYRLSLTRDERPLTYTTTLQQAISKVGQQMAVPF